MSSVPPFVTAMFDQAQAATEADGPLPDGVVLQLRVRRVADGGSTALAADLTTAVDSHVMAGAALVILERIVAEFASDVTRNLAELMGSGPEGFLEALQIVRMIQEGREEEPMRVSDDGPGDR